MNVRYRRKRAALKCSALIIAACGAALAPPPPLALAQQPVRGRSVIAIDHTLQAALGQPRVWVQVSCGDDPIHVEDDPTTRSFLAYLDTGASGYVVGAKTAERFKLATIQGAIYNEVGLHGPTAVEVTQPYTISLSGGTGEHDEVLRPRDLTFTKVQHDVCLQVDRAPLHGIAALLGDLNVVGMPAISRLVLELDPSPLCEPTDRRDRNDPFALDLLIRGDGPSVRVCDKAPGAKEADVLIALEYVDFNQRDHPDNRGALPELAKNPMVSNIVCEVDWSDGASGLPVRMKRSSGDWLLDTGAAATVISV